MTLALANILRFYISCAFSIGRNYAQKLLICEFLFVFRTQTFAQIQLSFAMFFQQKKNIGVHCLRCRIFIPSYTVKLLTVVDFSESIFFSLVWALWFSAVASL